jgi:seryl-tRNA synthetase
MRCLDMLEAERGSKVAGHRGYFLKGVGVLLN